MSDCGSYGGYQRHKRRDEEPCEPCRAANAAYLAEYRAANPAAYVRHKRRQAARNRALAELGRRHRAELLELVEVELERLVP